MGYGLLFIFSRSSSSGPQFAHWRVFPWPIAGGVNLILSPEININLSLAHMLSPDGHCKTFDAKADGYVRSDGCGIVILKRLQDAIRDHDPLIAVVRSSLVSQDGASGGLTVPNGLAQEQLMRQALANARIESKDVHYLEAHGTGTSLGDPIEVRSIGDVYGDSRENPLVIGAVKSTLGIWNQLQALQASSKPRLSCSMSKFPKIFIMKR